MTNKKKKILFVAMHHSIHTARWVDMVADGYASLHMFPLDPDPHHALLRNITIHLPCLSVADAALPAPAPQESTSRSLMERIAASARDPRGALTSAWRRFRERPAPVPEPTCSEALVLPFQPTVEELGGPEAAAQPTIRLGESENAAPTLHGPGVLASVIRRVKPDLIHSMEFQHAGYLVLQAKEIIGEGFPPWLATNWGSDIFYFSRFPDHNAQIRRMLKAVDYYSCECQRDIALAREFGFTGKTMPVLPNTGGFDLDHLATLRSPLPPSKRKVLMIKGYEHFAGRAMTSLKVLTKFADRLRDYEVILFSVSAEPRKTALELAEKGVLNIRVIDWATHDEILSCFGRARLYMGISISDAISTSVLESMAMGAFPIQTNTSCCNEWFEDGKGGFVIPPDDFDVICDRFLRALEDDALVDAAAGINARTVAERLDKNVLRPQIATFYDSIL